MEYEIRPLEKADLYNGFLETLDYLSKPEGKSNADLSQEIAEKNFSDINSNPDHTIYVAHKDGFVFSTITLLIERKFIHEGRNVGHIEDVVTHQKFQRNVASTKILKKLLEIADQNNCYKTILDCSENTKKFYERIGFVEKGKEMRYEHKKNSNNF